MNRPSNKSLPDDSKAPSQEITRAETRLVTLTSPGPLWDETVVEAHKSVAGRTISSLMASPRGVMILVPLLVLALGGALTIIGQLALEGTSRKMARDRFVAQTSSVTHGLDNTLSQAEPLLGELSRIALAAHRDFVGPKRSPAQPVDDFEGKGKTLDLDERRLNTVALELRDLLIGRAGVTHAYFAYPDGLFLSADPNDSGDIEIAVTKDGTSTIYRIQDQRVERVAQRKSEYDPRQRSWYSQAVAQRKRVWSPPYSFFFSHHTGVTRSEALFSSGPKRSLLAVVGVDFDVDALTSFMAGAETQNDYVNAIVFTGQGVVLAYPKAAKRLKEIQGNEKVASHESLGDPAVSALIEHVKDNPTSVRPGQLLQLEANGEHLLASLRRVAAGGPNWYVATFSPQRSVLRDLYDHRQSSLVVGTLSLLFAMSLAWFLARRLNQVSREAQLAQDAAAAARNQARDLGSYRLVSRLGEGGMGQVWRASHRLLARQAAIKLIKAVSTDEKRSHEQRERFRREAQAIAGLRSRNTVALFDYGVTPDGTLFYVMELLDGIDLSTLVYEFGPQPAERVRQILIQACNSLTEAHDAGLVHRDIKPANLFLCREADDVDVVKVLDFGLVSQAEPLPQVELSADPDETEPDTALRATLPGPSPSTPPAAPLEGRAPTPSNERITQAEHQLGTPAFMSPEQALGGTTDGRSDLYSLACVAYFLLTGRTPFAGEAPLAVMIKHVEEPPPHLRDVMKEPVSRAFESLLEECLEKSPLDRPQSARELRDKLRRLGVQTPDFSEEQAQAWWREHRPLPEISASHKLAPLRDAEVIVPTPHR